MRIFLIGFNKCGTTSFHHFFTENRFRSQHWMKNKLAFNLYQHFEGDGRKVELLDNTAYSDIIYVPEPHNMIEELSIFVEGNKYYRELDKQYPDSLFILNTRNPIDWIRSRFNHGSGSFATRYKNFLNVKTDQELQRAWLQQWFSYHADVLDYFSEKENFLLYDIEKSDEQDLIDFLSPYIQLSLKKLPHSYKTKR